MSEAASTTAAFIESCLAGAADRESVSAVREWFAIRTHPGLVRAENQDRVAVAWWTRRGAQAWAMVVADGIGSGKAGAEAAVVAVAAFLGTLVETARHSLDGRLADAAERANQVVYHRWRGNEGTTLSAVLVSRDQSSLLNIGDSRIYGIDPDGETLLLTRDDVHPSIPGLLQFIGMGQDLVPHIHVMPPKFTRVLITSDGVHNYLEPLMTRLVRGAGLDGRVLVDRLIHLSNWCGGADNATCAVAALRGQLPTGAQLGPALDVWTPGMHHRMLGETAAMRDAKPAQRAVSPSRMKTDVAPRGPTDGRRTGATRPDRPPRPPITMAFGDEPQWSPPGEAGPAAKLDATRTDPIRSPRPEPALPEQASQPTVTMTNSKEAQPPPAGDEVVQSRMDAGPTVPTIPGDGGHASPDAPRQLNAEEFRAPDGSTEGKKP